MLDFLSFQQPRFQSAVQAQMPLKVFKLMLMHM